MCNCYGLTRVTDRCTDICDSLSTYYDMRDQLMNQVTMTPLNLRYKVADVARKISSEILTQLDLITYNLKTLHSKYIVAERPGYEMLEAHPPSVRFSFPDDPRLLKEYTAGTKTVTAPRMPEMTPAPEKLTVYPISESFMASSVMLVSVKDSYADPTYSDGSNDYHAGGYVFSYDPDTLPITYLYKYICESTPKGYVPVTGTYHRFQFDATVLEPDICGVYIEAHQVVARYQEFYNQAGDLVCVARVFHMRGSARFRDLAEELPPQNSDILVYDLFLFNPVLGGCDKFKYLYIGGITYELIPRRYKFLLVIRPGDQVAFEQPLHLMIVYLDSEIRG